MIEELKTYNELLKYVQKMENCSIEEFEKIVQKNIQFLGQSLHDAAFIIETALGKLVFSDEKYLLKKLIEIAESFKKDISQKDLIDQIKDSLETKEDVNDFERYVQNFERFYPFLVKDVPILICGFISKKVSKDLIQKRFFDILKIDNTNAKDLIGRLERKNIIEHIDELLEYRKQIKDLEGLVAFTVEIINRIDRKTFESKYRDFLQTSSKGASNRSDIMVSMIKKFSDKSVLAKYDELIEITNQMDDDIKLEVIPAILEKLPKEFVEKKYDSLIKIANDMDDIPKSEIISAILEKLPKEFVEKKYDSLIKIVNEMDDDIQKSEIISAVISNLPEDVVEEKYESLISIANKMNVREKSKIISAIISNLPKDFVEKQYLELLKFIEEFKFENNKNYNYYLQELADNSGPYTSSSTNIITSLIQKLPTEFIIKNYDSIFESIININKVKIINPDQNSLEFTNYDNIFRAIAELILKLDEVMVEEKSEVILELLENNKASSKKDVFSALIKKMPLDLIKDDIYFERLIKIAKFDKKDLILERIKRFHPQIEEMISYGIISNLNVKTDFLYVNKSDLPLVDTDYVEEKFWIRIESMLEEIDPNIDFLKVQGGADLRSVYNSMSEVFNFKTDNDISNIGIVMFLMDPDNKQKLMYAASTYVDKATTLKFADLFAELAKEGKGDLFIKALSNENTRNILKIADQKTFEKNLKDAFNLPNANTSDLFEKFVEHKDFNNEFLKHFAPKTKVMGAKIKEDTLTNFIEK